jgi:hypothetical protein
LEKRPSWFCGFVSKRGVTQRAISVFGLLLLDTPLEALVKYKIAVFFEIGEDVSLRDSLRLELTRSRNTA